MSTISVIKFDNQDYKGFIDKFNAATLFFEEEGLNVSKELEVIRFFHLFQHNFFVQFHTRFPNDQRELSGIDRLAFIQANTDKFTQEKQIQFSEKLIKKTREIFVFLQYIESNFSPLMQNQINEFDRIITHLEAFVQKNPNLQIDVTLYKLGICKKKIEDLKTCQARIFKRSQDINRHITGLIAEIGNWRPCTSWFDQHSNEWSLTPLLKTKNDKPPSIFSFSSLPSLSPSEKIEQWHITNFDSIFATISLIFTHRANLLESNITSLTESVVSYTQYLKQLKSNYRSAINGEGDLSKKTVLQINEDAISVLIYTFEHHSHKIIVEIQSRDSPSITDRLPTFFDFSSIKSFLSLMKK